MKNGQVIKSAGVATEQQLALINGYTRRKLTADDVYVFSVVLCDNDIDRDYERFTVESLFSLEKLFLGKTGVFDHEPKAKNQTARIFDCKVEAVESKKTSTGDDYFRLVAKAYMPKSEKNADLILSLECGITKEISVGCAVEKVQCSVCSNDMGSASCSHIKGNTYSDRLCFGELVSPYDAYEFSFVAIPAQKNAGVIKAFDKGNGKGKNMNEIIKSLQSQKSVTLEKSDCEKLLSYIGTLEKSAEDGEAYRNELEKNVLSMSSLIHPHLSNATMKGITSKLSTSELKELCSAYSEKAEDILPRTPQLYNKTKEQKNSSDNQFTI